MISALLLAADASTASCSSSACLMTSTMAAASSSSARALSSSLLAAAAAAAPLPAARKGAWSPSRTFCAAAAVSPARSSRPASAMARTAPTPALEVQRNEEVMFGRESVPVVHAGEAHTRETFRGSHWSSAACVHNPAARGVALGTRLWAADDAKPSFRRCRFGCSSTSTSASPAGSAIVLNATAERELRDRRLSVRGAVSFVPPAESSPRARAVGGSREPVSSRKRAVEPMCHRVTCGKCGKPSWVGWCVNQPSGSVLHQRNETPLVRVLMTDGSPVSRSCSGFHVETALAGVPLDERCKCKGMFATVRMRPAAPRSSSFMLSSGVPRRASAGNSFGSFMCVHTGVGCNWFGVEGQVVDAFKR